MPDLHSQPVRRLADADAPHTALVLCHGRGATAQSLTPLVEAVARPGVVVLAPQADAISDVLQWYPNSFLGQLASNEPYLSAALGAVHQSVEVARGLGLGDEQIVIGGFSQGACLASEYAARNARRWGGVVALSGGLLGTAEDHGSTPTLRGAGGVLYPDKRFDYAGSLAHAPVLLACAEQDPHIPVERLRRSADIFRSLGGDVDLRVYPGSVHAVVDDEVTYLRGLLEHLAC